MMSDRGRRMAALHRALWLSVMVVAVSRGVIATSYELNTYIVQMSKLDKPSVFTTHDSWYESTFSAVKGGRVETTSAESELDGILYTYGVVFNGFSARLTAAEAEALQSTPGVLRVEPEVVSQLHTTYTPEFLGLNSNGGLLWESRYGEDVIIGVLDTGVWPERASFRDDGIGPIPSRWKGSCAQEPTFHASLCNRKLIGAKYYSRGYEASKGPMNTSLEYKSPRDGNGHGTHCASTAGGQEVYGASLGGFAEGTARGVAPKARLAIYKICWATGCYQADILAAFDDAVADGVDVISLSVGSAEKLYHKDNIAIGAYGAAKKGVFVSCSAGNDGPEPSTVSNIAPWITTVGASTVDRSFPVNVKLGNGKSYEGKAFYTGLGLGNKLIPVIYAGNASKAGVEPSRAASCRIGSLDTGKVKGKIVLCDRDEYNRVQKSQICEAAGAAGMILANRVEDGEELVVEKYFIPGILVGAKAGASIKDYVISTPDGKALITGETVFGVKPAPVTASFSSRGPSSLAPAILKPDITAPGVNILAAWTGNYSVTKYSGDDRIVDFNIINGTSMSCPHISAVGALLKGARPEWTPAAIKSAIMTSAYSIDNSGSVILDEATGIAATPFSYGSGHVDPQKAVDPGLIYDLKTSDYVTYLCSLNYPIQIIDSDVQSCADIPKGSPNDLNYPSFSAVFDQTTSSAALATSFKRTVKNVGNAKSTYTVSVTAPSGVKITVVPSILKFSDVNQELSFRVNVATSPVDLDGKGIESAFGHLVWTDGTHTVRSPIVINWRGSVRSSTVELSRSTEQDGVGDVQTM